MSDSEGGYNDSDEDQDHDLVAPTAHRAEPPDDSDDDEPAELADKTEAAPAPGTYGSLEPALLSAS